MWRQWKRSIRSLCNQSHWPDTDVICLSSVGWRTHTHTPAQQIVQHSLVKDLTTLSLVAFSWSFNRSRQAAADWRAAALTTKVALTSSLACDLVTKNRRKRKDFAVFSRTAWSQMFLCLLFVKRATFLLFLHIRAAWTELLVSPCGKKMYYIKHSKRHHFFYDFRVELMESCYSLSIFLFPVCLMWLKQEISSCQPCFSKLYILLIRCLSHLFLYIYFIFALVNASMHCDVSWQWQDIHKASCSCSKKVISDV